jgi:hypothetical protein
MGMRRMLSALAGLPIILALGALPVAAAPGGTGHTVTSTQHEHGVFTDPTAFNPCTGRQMSITVDGNSVTHITYFPDSDELWFTFTETGTFTGVDGDVTYTGHFTVWDNQNVNRQNANATFTFSVRAYGSDGSTITGHEVAHFAMNANGTLTVLFDKPGYTCG